MRLVSGPFRRAVNDNPETRLQAGVKTEHESARVPVHSSCCARFCPGPIGSHPEGSWMKFHSRSISLVLLSITLTLPAWAQISQILQPSETAKEKAPTDPLGRQTPNGTLFGFLQAVQEGNYLTAAQYLQLSPARRASQGERLATELKTVLDGGFVGSLKAISTNPEGSGVLADREKVGTLSVDDSEVDVILVRVN